MTNIIDKICFLGFSDLTNTLTHMAWLHFFFSNMPLFLETRASEKERKVQSDGIK